MRHHATSGFWKTYDALSGIRQLAVQNFEKLETNPKHPSLRLKQVGRFWSVRVGQSWCALAV
ncbi:type II toxin-antitoxin system RelE family toxin [Pararhizobium antarcticum]|uniref:type II toxin-antitoxin system RelE family toxin n=1 Tax=Pararhizobium antarcticum TaxID=1798805 RepID=UPI0008FFAEA6|nr:hypothetical protein [Pararhizobium antarcticum]